MYILDQSVGNYHQIIKINNADEPNTVKVIMGKTVIYDGIAIGIIDTGSTLTFKTPDGETKKNHKYTLDTSI